MNTNISKDIANLLKGIAILMIAIHNYYHITAPSFGENEFYYSDKILTNNFHYLLKNPADLIDILFSYFGHYGVQIFVFFSAYGLTTKYKNTPIEGYFTFIRKRFTKLYIAFAASILMYIALGYTKSILLHTQYEPWWETLAYKLLLIANIIPNQALTPVGPWWFMSFIFSYYIFFPLLINAARKYGGYFLFSASTIGVLIEYLYNDNLQSVGLNINYLFLGIFQPSLWECT